MNEREALAKKIMQTTFTVIDVGLYLDSHPCDAEALEYYRKQNALRSCLVAEYEEKFGPLTIYGSLAEDKWDWVECPWPWETGDMSYVEL